MVVIEEKVIERRVGTFNMCCLSIFVHVIDRVIRQVSASSMSSRETSDKVRDHVASRFRNAVEGSIISYGTQ